MISENDKKRLLQEAKTASGKAYSPYSKYPVGSAVLTTNGNMYSGCNIENASFSLTICAERVAVSKAISEGDQNLLAIAVYSPKGNISPCGACRQFIREFGSEIEVIYEIDGVVKVKKIKDIIPDSFSEDYLK